MAEAHTILQKDLHAGTDSIMPSARMMKLWDKLIQMRKWLRGEECLCKHRL